MTDKTDVTTTTAPERIWLQVDTGYCGDDRSEPFPTDFDGVTWHSEEIGGLEVEYVRADELARLRAEVARLSSSRDFYFRRCEALQEVQSLMRDPERKAVCDILANGQTAPGTVAKLKDATAIVARLEAEKAEAVKDAERYRWLRDTGDVTWTPFSRRTGFSAGMADTAIDAAMRGDREDG